MMPERVDGASEEAPLKPGDLFQSKWEIIRLLGRGGYAWVYHARHRFIGRHVAIKIIFKPGGVSKDVFQRGLAEAQIQHKLDHHNIVKVDDAGTSEDSGFLYIIMELLRGWSWRSMLTEFKRLRVEEALRLAASVADAMQVAHNGGIIHRDLKPENVFIVGENQPKVLDFGIAKINQAAWVTEKDMVLGTMIYMSPEQIQAMPLTPKSDIYALGVMMYEALAGQHPVYMRLKTPQANLYELSRIVVTQSPPTLHEVDPSIPAYVADLVYPAIAKPPNERFSSMKAFAHAIRACLRRYEAEALEHGISLRTRDLSRRPSTSSGVNEIDAQSPPTEVLPVASLPSSADTEPNSSPMFLGAVSSGMLGEKARPGVAALAPTMAMRGTHRMDSPSEPAIRTAPLGSPAEPDTEVRGTEPPPRKPSLRPSSSTPIPGSVKVNHAAPQSVPPMTSAEHGVRLSRVLALGALVGFVAFGAGAFIYTSSGKTSRAETAPQPSEVRATRGAERAAPPAHRLEAATQLPVASSMPESPPTPVPAPRSPEQLPAKVVVPAPVKAKPKPKPVDKMEERLRQFERGLDEQKKTQPKPSAPEPIGPMF